MAHPHLVFFNPTRKAVTVYAADGDSVILQPLRESRVDPKFKWQIPSGIQLRADHSDESDTLAPPTLDS